jgi:hypothetical protein
MPTGAAEAVRAPSVGKGRLAWVISHQRAEQLLDRLAKAAGASADELADLLAGRVDSRRIDNRRVTGFRQIRSSQGGGRWVLDRYGTDRLPESYAVPTERVDSAPPTQRSQAA